MSISKSIPVKHDIHHKEGDTLERSWTFTLAGQPSDMSGVTPEIVIDSPSIPNFTLSNGLSWGTGPNAHKLYLSKLWSFGAGSFNYELKLSSSETQIKRRVKGKIIIEAKIKKNV